MSRLLASHLDQLRFDLFKIRVRGLVGDLAEPLVFELALVPTLRPSEPVEKPVDLGFALARSRSVPATLGSVLLGVVPVGAAFGVEGEFGQPEDHHQVADHLGLVERSGEGPELYPVLAASEVGEVEQVVAVRFAPHFGGVFVAVGFDLLAVDRLFAAAGAGAGEDRLLVVADQADQSRQGGGVAVPLDRDVQLMESSP
jgi:hypothetical protein